MNYARLLALIVVSLGFTAEARAWWDGEWSIRKKITIDTSAADAAISDPIGQAAVLIRLHDGDFNFTAAKEDGSDIRFVAEDDKTLLPYHIERYDSLLNEAFIWVKVPEVKPGAKNTIWLYYGSAGAKAVRVEDAKGTYDSGTALVYHFSEKSGPPADISGKSATAENGGTAVTGSLIGGGVRLEGRKAISIPTSVPLTWTVGGALTWSAWIKPAASVPNAVLFSRRDAGSSLVIALEKETVTLEIASAGAPQKAAAAKPITMGAWHHIAVVAESGKATLFIDGESAAVLGASIPALATPLLLGGDTVDGAVGYVGEVDELNIANTARPLGWVKLAALSQGSGEKTGKVVAVGADEQTSSWLSEGYFGVIIKSLTADGWVVICILAVMAAMSWVVMVSKIRYLNGVSKGNGLFMKEWASLATDLTALDHGGDSEKARSLGGRLDKVAIRAMRRSSVYRIYHIGVEEIRHRLSAENSRKFLSSRSIQSIRASLDGGLVREKQRIDKLIVLLTICISGGPFLGLLGTVVGVMITFAAVAAAGEVNVNAIAPGIAAALLATVAGLAVAIPSLFGYNYILSRVKDSTADMHVFIDEFITRMAEFYSEPQRTRGDQMRPTARVEEDYEDENELIEA